MSLFNRMNDVAFLLTKRATKSKNFEEFCKEQTESAPSIPLDLKNNDYRSI